MCWSAADAGYERVTERSLQNSGYHMLRRQISCFAVVSHDVHIQRELHVLNDSPKSRGVR